MIILFYFILHYLSSVFDRRRPTALGRGELGAQHLGQLNAVAFKRVVAVLQAVVPALHLAGGAPAREEHVEQQTRLAGHQQASRNARVELDAARGQVDRGLLRRRAVDLDQARRGVHVVGEHVEERVAPRTAAGPRYVVARQVKLWEKKN